MRGAIWPAPKGVPERHDNKDARLPWTSAAANITGRHDTVVLRRIDLATTLAVRLPRRTSGRSVGAEYAAVTRSRLQSGSTTLAVAEVDTGVARHNFRGLSSTRRTGKRRVKFQNARLCTVHDLHRGRSNHELSPPARAQHEGHDDRSDPKQCFGDTSRRRGGAHRRVGHSRAARVDDPKSRAQQDDGQQAAGHLDGMLKFEKAGSVEVEFAVEAIGPSRAAPMGGMHHH